MSSDVDQRLVAAVQAGDEAAVAQALALGADPNATIGYFGLSVLVEAASSGRREVVRLLLDAGANVASPESRNASPLRVAVTGAHPEVVRLLLSRGALAQEPTDRGGVLAAAISSSEFTPTPTMLETLRLLLDAGATTGPHEEAPLVGAVMHSVAPAVLRVLLEHGADPDARRSDATPAIVLAARRGDQAAVDVLLRAGADVDATDARGRTALMHAVARDERRVVAVLLLAGATTESTDDDGMTALRLAQGWQRQSVQSMLGERRVGLDDVPIDRTAVRLVPTGVRLAGDPRMFHFLAKVIDIVLDDLDDNDWRTRTGQDAGTARTFAGRLRDDAVPATGASWYEVEASMAEYACARSALAELAYGMTRVVPDGSSRLEIIDLLQELARQAR